MYDPPILIKEMAEFWWDKPFKDHDDYFNFPTVWSCYDNYCFKIAPADKLGMFSIKLAPCLTVFMGNSLLFDGGMVMEYHVNHDHITNIKKEILNAAEGAHLEFIRVFNERESSSALISFEPQFQEHLFQQKLDLCLQPSTFAGF